MIRLLFMLIYLLPLFIGGVICYFYFIPKEWEDKINAIINRTLNLYKCDRNHEAMDYLGDFFDDLLLDGRFEDAAQVMTILSKRIKDFPNLSTPIFITVLANPFKNKFKKEYQELITQIKSLDNSFNLIGN